MTSKYKGESKENTDSDSDSSVVFGDDPHVSDPIPRSLTPEVSEGTSTETPAVTSTGTSTATSTATSTVTPTVTPTETPTGILIKTPKPPTSLIEVGNKVYIIDNPKGNNKGDPLRGYFSETEFEEDLCKYRDDCEQVKELFKKHFNIMRSKIYRDKLETITVDSDDNKTIIDSALKHFIEHLKTLNLRYVKNILPKKTLHSLLRIKIENQPAKQGNAANVAYQISPLQHLLLLMAWYITHSETSSESIRNTFNIIKLTSGMTDLINGIKKLKDFTNLDKNNIEIYTKSIIKLLNAYKQITDIPAADESLSSSKPLSFAPPPSIGGAQIDSQIPSQLLMSALKPIITYMKETNPAFSFIEQSAIPMYDVWGIHKLLHVCNALSNYDKYGIYKISNVPDELFSYIQHSIKYSLKNSTSIDKSHLIKKASFYQYLMCLDGNLSFVNKEYTKKQKKERKAVRTFFQKGDVYLLHTDQPELSFENYMDEPYYAYEINYDSIDEDNMIIPINTANSILNEEAVPLRDYITVNSSGIFTDHQLAMSLFLSIKTSHARTVMNPSMNRLLLKVKYSFYCALVFFLFANPETALVLQRVVGSYSPMYGLFFHTFLFFITILGLMLLPSE